ncbi:MAG TPA: hypothetical protein VL132_03225 [Planctomycetaceae bacterium]|nr:hypothetical protein [Planctomycetaceae bacterium]
MVDPADDQSWDIAVDKLIRLTEVGQLKWHEVRLPLRPLMQDFVGPQYVAEVEGKHIAVYEYSFPSESDEYGKVTSSMIRIEFVTSAGEPVWVWPVSKGRRQLLDAVRRQGTDANQFLEAFLADHV